MTSKYARLFETEAAEAYVIEEYVQNAIEYPEAVVLLTRTLSNTGHNCVPLMALVNALIKQGHTETQES